MVRHISLGNGSLLVNLDDSLRVRDIYFPYAGQENHVLGKPHKIGIHADGFSWLKDWNTTPSYKEDTIVTESRAVNDIEDLELVSNSCVHCDKNVFLREFELKNKREESRDVEIFFQQRFDMYGSGMADTAAFRPEENGIVHYKKNRYAMVDVKKEGGDCTDFNQYGIYRDNLDDAVRSKELNNSPIAQGDVDSAISLKVNLEPNSSEKFYYWINTGENFDEVRQMNHEVERNVENFFEQTEMCWKGFLGKLDVDSELLTDHIDSELKRSILVVRSQTNNNGAITAANDSENLEYNQDKYGYVWPRDAALVAEVMARAGYGELVKPYFDFAEKVIEEEGYLLHKYNPDGSLGSSWHPWVDEKGDRQLPIQEDETALTIWALKKYSEYTGDSKILVEKWDLLVKPAAEFMVEYMDEEKMLPQPSWDLWEEERYVSSFTVATVYAGLKAAGEIADQIGKEGEEYIETAEQIKSQGLKHLRSEETRRYVRGIRDGNQLDEVSAPLYFLEKLGLVEIDDEYFENTMNAIIYDLSPDTDIGGVARYHEDHYHKVTDDFDKVPGNPWVISTLWTAQYLIDKAETEDQLEKAQERMHWVCKNSIETGLLPEQVNPFTGEGVSVAPLTWSHTTFIETALIYADKKKEYSGEEEVKFV